MLWTEFVLANQKQQLKKLMLFVLLGFTINGIDFTEFSEFSELRESTEAWIRINLTVFSVKLCLCGSVAEFLSLTQEIVGSSPATFLK